MSRRMNYASAAARSRAAADKAADRAGRMAKPRPPLRARFASTCPVCAHAIEPRSPIAKAFPSTKRYKHAECPKEEA